MVCKLVWYEQGTGDAARIKLAGAKSTWPDRKQIFHRGAWEGDPIHREVEPPPPDATPLLHPLSRAGAPVSGALPPLSEIRRAAEPMAAPPESHRRLNEPVPAPVVWSDGLREVRQRASEVRWQDD